MLLEIDNKIIIVDEAHNMEDSSREAASLSFNNVQVTDVSMEIDKIKFLCECGVCEHVSGRVCVCVCVCGGCRVCVCVCDVGLPTVDNPTHRELKECYLQLQAFVSDIVNQ